jgi:hypothetical protein
MCKKSIIFGALLCLLSTSSTNAASVWSTELLFDGTSDDWRLHVVSDDIDLLNPANITGVYLDNVINSQIDPIDLLTISPAVIANNDPYDFVSNSQIISVMQPAGLGEIIIKQLDTFGSNGIGQQQALTCREYSCTTWLRHPDGGNRQVLSRPGSPSPQLILTRSALTPVPVPAAVWLFGSGLIGLIGVARRKKA